MSLSDLVTPLQRRTLSADVYQQLRDLLISGRMMPGEPISLRSTAQALGVSVMPVREAVHRLVAEKALELTPKRTLRVPLMAVNEFREITTIRMQLEGLASATAALALDDADEAKISAWHDAFSKEMDRARPDGARLIALNKELHFAVYRSAAMPVLMQLIEALWLRIGPILNHDLRSGSSRISERTAITHHARLVDALRHRDAEAARSALHGDIASAADHIIDSGVLLSADTGKDKPASAAALRAGRTRAR